MTLTDSKTLSRSAQRLVVEFKRGSGIPPTYERQWQPLWGAKVDRIEINPADKPSVAVIWLPGIRWHSSVDLIWGDMVRIRTDEQRENQRTIIFVGFVAKYASGFSGGSGRPGSSYERNGVMAVDHRWLLSITTPIFGQIARGPDDYNNYFAADESPIDNSSTFMSGRRCIFNENGRPNRDSTALAVTDSAGTKLCDMPIFADPDYGVTWSARDMINYCLSPRRNQAYDFLKIDDPLQLIGLDHDDFDKVINHVVVDGLNVLNAIAFICKNIGWSFREEYYYNGTVTLVFYKVAAASAYTRTNSNPTILHQLHAPAVGETIDTAVGLGKKMLWSMDLDEDITRVVNNPWGLGAPHRFEFTAELVPAWLDSDLAPDTANLFLTDAELAELDDPDSNSFFNLYHARGSSFRRDVGRRWALNESGWYTNPNTYNRGMPFDFSADSLGIDPDYVKADGKRLFGPFKRQLLPCLTSHKDSLNSIGIVVEFSFDAGVTWQIIPCAIKSLTDECGIYIAEPNLAELVDQYNGEISGGTLDKEQLNYYSSLCDDSVNSRSFKDGQWKTRVRITASVQLDQRLARQLPATINSGSPFLHSHIYDLSNKYWLSKRATSSIFDSSSLPVNEVDSNAETDPLLDNHLEAIRNANEDMSISGQFTLNRLWLGDGRTFPDFVLGDCIEKITGREYPLSATFGKTKVYPEIVQIIYLPEVQRQKLITRDLRYAEVVL